MGEIYRARDTRLDRHVAIKILPATFAGDANRLARLQREARAVAALSHPNILAIHDIGTHDGGTFLVMELLEGETLRARLNRGALPWPEAIEIGAAIAEGLAAAHAKGIVHRDLKPDNLFLTIDGRTKILDFGLARMPTESEMEDETRAYLPPQTDPGMILGTVGYMSPEQVRGRTAEAASDIFSLGCVLHEMLTGKRTFQRDSAADTMTAILRDEPADLNAPGLVTPAEFVRIIRQCLAKSPHQRLHSARDVALALRATTNHPGQMLAGVRPAIEAVAVLPFENVGGDAKTEYLSDGLAEQLIISLSQVRRDNLKVRPFTSVSRYKRLRPDVLTIGRELGVQTLVTGTLHQSGSELWIGVALIDAREDDQLWGKRYQGELGGILDLQDQIVRDVAANLRLRLTHEEDQRLTRRYTEDPEAYLLYREATYHWNKFTPEGLQTSIDYCRRALQKDPNYALAHVGLGRSYHVLSSVHIGWRETYSDVKDSLEQAVRIDPALAEAHTGRAAFLMMHDWDWVAAKNELDRALAVDPSDANIWEMYCFHDAAHGRLSEAFANVQRALELNPLSARTSDVLAMCLNWMRQYDRAIVESRRMLELDYRFPLAYPEIGLALVESGRPDEAIAQLQLALNAGHTHPRTRGMLGYAYAAAGDRAKARRVLQELQSAAPTQFGVALPIARIYAALGENDQAFAWLKKSCDERDSIAMWIKVDPTMDKLRSDPRYAELLREMGLPPDTHAPALSAPPVAQRRRSPPTRWVVVGILLVLLAITAVVILVPTYWR
jgi:serine/threonine protein kinase/Tfp pilus assembly protein PilF